MISFRTALAATTSDTTLLARLVVDPDPSVAHAALANPHHPRLTVGDAATRLTEAVAARSGSAIHTVLDASVELGAAAAAEACRILAAAWCPELVAVLEEDDALDGVSHVIGVAAEDQTTRADAEALAVDVICDTSERWDHVVYFTGEAISTADALRTIVERAPLDRVESTLSRTWPTIDGHTFDELDLDWVGLIDRCVADRGADDETIRDLVRWVAASADTATHATIAERLGGRRASRVRRVTREGPSGVAARALFGGVLGPDGNATDLTTLAGRIGTDLGDTACTALAGRIIAHPATPPHVAGRLALEAAAYLPAEMVGALLGARRDDVAVIAGVLLAAARGAGPMMTDALAEAGVDRDALADGIDDAFAAANDEERELLQLGAHEWIGNGHPHAVRHLCADDLELVLSDGTPAQREWLAAQLGDDETRADTLDALTQAVGDHTTVGELLDTATAVAT